MGSFMGIQWDIHHQLNGNYGEAKGRSKNQPGDAMKVNRGLQKYGKVTLAALHHVSGISTLLHGLYPLVNVCMTDRKITVFCWKIRYVNGHFQQLTVGYHRVLYFSWGLLPFAFFLGRRSFQSALLISAAAALLLSAAAALS